MFLTKNSFFRFELVKKDSGVPLDVVNLVISPYTLGYDGRYRDSVIKTFGGTHIDLAGMDNDVIKISGTFSGKRMRVGWSKSGFGMLDAVGALKHLRDDLWKYPDNPKYSLNWKDLRVKFYDVGLGEMRWVHINTVSFTRDKSQPYWYNYSIQLTDIGEPDKLAVDNDLTKALAAYKQKIQGVLNVVQQAADEIYNAVAEVEQYADTALGFVDTTAQAIVVVATTISSVFDTVFGFPERFIERLGETITQLSDVAEAIDILVNSVPTTLEYGASLVHSMEELSENTKEMVRAFKQIRKRSDTAVVVAGTLDKGLDVTDIGFAVGGTAKDSMVSVVVKEGQTLSEIAIQLYGDESRANELAVINELESSFVPEGTIIKVLIYSEQSEIEGNLVINDDGDEYGKDISLSVNGDAESGASGDFVIIGGQDNIEQLVRSIFKINLGSYVSDSSFGFDQSLIGGAGSANTIELIQVKLAEALKKDPRIAVVKGLTAIIKGDIFQASGTVLLHNKLRPVPFSLEEQL